MHMVNGYHMENIGIDNSNIRVYEQIVRYKNEQNKF